MIGSIPIFALLLLIAGIILIIIEVFIPGFGFFGISGIIALGVGIFFMASSIEQAVLILMVTIITLTILGSILIKLLFNRKIKSPIILYETLEEDTSDMTYFIGKKGIALTVLRPAGKGDFDGVTLDVMSGGMFIEKGSFIEVKRIDGNKIIVSSIKE